MKGASELRVAVTPPAVLSAAEARDLRARCWLYIFQAYYAKKGAGRSGRDDAKEVDRCSRHPQNTTVVNHTT